MDTLNEKLSEYQHQLASMLDRKRSLENQAAEMGQRAAVIEARIAGILEAAELLKTQAAEQKRERSSQPKRRQRELSPQWKAILAKVDSEAFIDGSFSYDDLDAAAKATNHEASRDTLRSQMSLYKQAGLVETGKEVGTFMLTDAGRKAAGIEESEAQVSHENEAPSGNPAGASEAAGQGGATPWSAFGSNPQPWHRA